MDIRVNVSLGQTPGCFGTRVTSAQGSVPFLEVPPDLWKFVTYAAIHPKTAESLVSYIWTFPGALKFAMGWTLEEVETARGLLCAQLQGFIDPRHLRTAIEPQQTHFLT